MKKILQIFVISLLCTEVFAQNDQLNIERYWYYRNRLKYFVKVGTEQGQSCIASKRNLDYDNVQPTLHYGDQVIFAGWYVGVLATEYSLLAYNYQNTQKTLYELYCALEAYKRIDRCEDKPPWNLSSSYYDGFFMRDDVDNNFLDDPENLAALNEGLVTGEQYPFGHPAPVNFITSNCYGQPMSQDQAIHHMLGMSLVTRCLPNTSLSVYES